MSGTTLHCGDCLERMRAMPPRSVQLTMCSPPYESARLYAELGFKMSGQAFVDWCRERFMECLRVTDGLVAWVIEGQTKDFAWSGTPALLMADLLRSGVKLRHPAAYIRDGVPGSGGREWLKNRWEFIVCAAHGKLPWAENTAMGRPPIYETGGACSNRHADGRRHNQSKRGRLNGSSRGYAKPKIANPGNFIVCGPDEQLIDTAVGIDCGPGGGGNIGSPLAHENEAPYPEKLAEFFIRSFCPPGGTVLDPFCGSGTTLAVAVKNGRNAIGIDIRQSQIDLTTRRLATVEPLLFASPISGASS